MMKRKLSVALVAAALELYTASLAHAACAADGATPFAAGPRSPVTGFAEYVTDSTGLSLQLCRNAEQCFFDPVMAGNLQSEQSGFGGEGFFWLSDANIDVPATGFALRLVMAAEAAYATEVPADGDQFAFTRLRIWIDAPRPGVYTVTHPFGEVQYTITTVGAGFDSRETFDISFTPGQTAAKGRVGPWLKWDPLFDPQAPAGYIGDLGTPHRVVGSPCGTNFLRVTAVDFNGQPIDLKGTGSLDLTRHIVETDQFVVNGQLYDGRVQTPLSADRITYTRTPLTVGQVDVFAHSAPNATVTVKDSAGTPAAGARLTAPRTLSTDGAGAFFTSEVLANAPNTPNLPKAVALSAIAADNSTDPTLLVRPLVDQVTIQRADYDLSTGTLVVRATSSDTRVPPVLTLQEYNVPASQTVTTKAPPGRVTVISSAGGWDAASVRVVPEAAPDAPTGLAATANSATEVALVWRDNSINETGFDVERNGAVIARLPANTTTYLDAAVPQDTPLTYQVFANNAGGRAGSNTISVTTGGGLNAPSNLAATAVTATSVALGWLDNSNNETSFQVLRNGVVIATLAPNTATYTDTTVAASTAYTYQVVAAMVSATAGASAVSDIISITTPVAVTLLAPTNLTAVRPANDDTVTRLAWTDASTGETAYRVQRTTYTVAANGTVTATAFATTTTPIGSLTANAMTYINTGTALNTLYGYQVNAVNGATQGPAALVNRYTGTLPVPAGLRSNVTAGLLGLGATSRGQVPLTWTASNVAAVAGYEVEMCAGSTATCGGTGATWSQVVRTAGRAVNSFNVNGLTSSQAYSFRIRSHTGTVGFTSAWSALVAGTPR